MLVLALACSGPSTTTHTPSPPGEAARHVQDCDAGDRTACHAAALDAYYQGGLDEVAVRRFTAACHAGYAPSCNGLGVMYAEGRGVPQDDVEAARLYRVACAAGASTGCQHLAEAHRRGRGVALDDAIATRLDERAKCSFEASLGNGSLEDCPAME